MLNSQVRRIWFMVFVLGVFLAGCGRQQITPDPTLTSITPSSGFPGQPSFLATLAGTNFAPGSTISPIAGVTITNTTVVSSTQITATFAILSTAVVGPRSVTVTSQGRTSNAVTFTVNLTPPIIISTNPVSGATGVVLNQTITATFNRVMNAATINTATFTLNQGATVIPGAVTYSGTTASFKPTVNLLPSLVYRAQVTSGAQDTSGNGLAAVSPVPNPWTFTTGTTTDVTPPTIILTSPASGATGVLLNKAVSATFSKAMDPNTINGVTFTLAGPGTAPVTGTVTYNVPSQIATFTPSSNLSPATTYTARVTSGASGAKDLVGNPLAAVSPVPNPWSFTTGTTTSVGPPPLGTASTFGSFGGTAGITNQGILTVINGDIGTTGVSTIVTGFHDPGPGCIYTETPLNVGAVSGKIFTAPPPPTVGCPTEGTAATMATATQAKADALTAYNALVAIPGGPDPGAGELGGLTLLPGVYTAAAGTFKISGTAGTSDLTLNAQGDPNAVWIFQMSMALTVGSAGPTGARSVILTNGAQAKNVFWQVGSAATINGASGGTFVGTIIANTGAITFSTAGTPPITTLNGRALALTAAVTMVNTVINVPAP